MITALPLLVAAVAELLAPSVEAMARGDAHYLLRAEGAVDGIARPERVDAAIADYKAAIELDPASLEARVRLLRAYFFRGGFCGMSARDAAPVFEEARRVAEETVKRLEDELKRPRKDRRTADEGRARLIAQVYLWAATSWGQWAAGHSLKAAWRGAPRRIRDLALSSVAIDPSLEQAGGHTIVGRLHTETPKVRVITGWIDRDLGVKHLRLAAALAPENPAPRYLLADALLRRRKDAVPEARALLQGVISATPRAEYAVEDGHYIRNARRLLETVESQAAVK
jgi:tetratricopeptide (TPR) repeat protein